MASPEKRAGYFLHERGHVVVLRAPERACFVGSEDAVVRGADVGQHLPLHAVFDPSAGGAPRCRTSPDPAAVEGFARWPSSSTTRGPIQWAWKSISPDAGAGCANALPAMPSAVVWRNVRRVVIAARLMLGYASAQGFTREGRTMTRSLEFLCLLAGADRDLHRTIGPGSGRRLRASLRRRTATGRTTPRTCAGPSTRRSIRSTPPTSASSKWRGASRPTAWDRVPSTSWRARRSRSTACSTPPAARAGPSSRSTGRPAS